MPFSTARKTVITDPPIARILFSDTRLSWLWLLVRLYVGYSWITSGLGKFGNPAWMDTGDALKGFWTNAVAIPETGRPPVTFDWYREFLTMLLDGGHHVWFAKLVVFGEILIGAALIAGAFVGFAALFGAFMNWNFMMAGTASTNPVLFALAILLILAWKTAGHLGLDRVLLPLLGTPWRPTAAREHSARAERPGAAQPDRSVA
jgi:thiosulfate dehydrogenase (quinone) large subunit